MQKCRFCKTEFQQKHKDHFYCNKDCKNNDKSIEQKTKPKKKNCKVCWTDFEPYTSLDKFCWLACRIKNQKSQRTRNWSDPTAKNMCWKNNPAYKHWLRVKQKNAKFSRQFQKNCKILDEKLIEEKWYRYCEHCWVNQSLRWEHHHIIYRSEKPKHEYLHDIRNILHLCIKCHNEFHKHKPMRESYVRERKLQDLFWNDVLLYYWDLYAT